MAYRRSTRNQPSQAHNSRSSHSPSALSKPAEMPSQPLPKDLELNSGAEAILRLQQTYGNRAVGRLISRSKEPSADPFRRPSLSGNGDTKIQRMMSPEEFKKQTKGMWRKKSDVSNIDAKLVQYEGYKGSVADLVPRHNLLQQIEADCLAYAGGRAAGVTALLNSVRKELTFIKPLAESATEITGNGDLKLGLQKLFKGQDAILKAIKEGHRIGPKSFPNYSDLFGKAQRALDALGTRGQVMQELILEDLQKLQDMAADPGTDPLMAGILNEVLANTGEIHFQETAGMASGAVKTTDKDRAAGIAKEYRIDMNLFQKEGSPERISSLLHEMTHIAIQEKFGHTAVHLAFAKNMPKDQVLALSAKRTAHVNALKAELASNQAAFTPGQLDVLQEKVTYPTEGKNTLKSYAGNMFKKGEITQAEKDYIDDLEDSGANNTLTEFDTVINQMLFLMNGWNIPANNSFHAKLKTVAQEAYEHRTA